MNKQRGFTLLEILIALVIFAIIGVLAAMSLHQVLRNNKALDAQDQRLMQLQLAMTLIRRDILQAINRPIIDASGDKVSAFTGSGSTITFTRTGLMNPLNVARRTNMQRVGYVLKDGALERLIWAALDQPPGAKPERKRLVDEVSSVQWQFVDRKRHTKSGWPQGDDGESQVPEPLPKAVLLTMQIKGEGSIHGVFPVPATGGVSATDTTDSTDTTP